MQDFHEPLQSIGLPLAKIADPHQRHAEHARSIAREVQRILALEHEQAAVV